MIRSWRKIEIVTKGLANHRRLEILDLLGENPELSVKEISTLIKTDFNNASAHVNRLMISGLIMKRHDGNFVRHKLTFRGLNILKFFRMLE